MSVLDSLKNEVIKGDSGREITVCELKFDKPDSVVKDYRSLAQLLIGNANFYKLSLGRNHGAKVEYLVHVSLVSKARPLFDQLNYSLKPSDTVDYARRCQLYKALADAGVDQIVHLGRLSTVYNVPKTLMGSTRRRMAVTRRNKRTLKLERVKIIWT